MPEEPCTDNKIDKYLSRDISDFVKYIQDEKKPTGDN